MKNIFYPTIYYLYHFIYYLLFILFMFFPSSPWPLSFVPLGDVGDLWLSNLTCKYNCPLAAFILGHIKIKK